MNTGFPPLQFPRPEIRLRKKGGSQLFKLPDDLEKRRAKIAGVLYKKVAGLSRRLEVATEKERKAIFYKLTHGPTADIRNLLSGTDLRPLRELTSEVVFAAPKADSLDALLNKITEFRDSPSNRLKHSWLARTEIEEGTPQDRLSPEIQEDYSSIIQQDFFLVEIEFFSLENSKKKQIAEITSWINLLQRELARSSGAVFEYEMAEPTCRAVLRCKGSMFKRLVEDQEWRSRIRWFESRPKFQTFREITDNFKFSSLRSISSPPITAPTVCIIDTGVTSGNPFLKPLVRDGMNVSFLKDQPNNPNDEYGHGSAVAALASYYSLNLSANAVNEPKAWIAGARILNEENELEDERLFSKLLEEVVEHFDKKGVKVFCLAVGDKSRIWTSENKNALPRKSWVARKIDQLSRDYDVIFVTCTGNLSIPEISEKIADGDEFPSYLSSPDCQILDPGHAALAITVGSIAHSTTLISSRGGNAIASRHFPSPFTRTGPGIRGEQKPELVEYGGNLMFDETLQRASENMGLKIPSASKQLTPAVSYCSGTSFAAPRVAHQLALIQADLRSLGVWPSGVLMKAFLVNSSRHRLKEADRIDFCEKVGAEKQDMVLGHGKPDGAAALDSNDYSVVAYYEGEMEADTVMFLDVPVPASLAKANGYKRLTVTVSYSPEVQKWGLERYLSVDLKWRMFRGDKSRDDIVAAMSENDDESDLATLDDFFQEDDSGVSEVILPDELAFSPKARLRSKGTVQHGSYTWKNHRATFSQNHYVLAISASKKWSRSVAAFSLGVVVRIEDLGQSVPIYQEISNSIKVQSQVRVRS